MNLISKNDNILCEPAIVVKSKLKLIQQNNSFPHSETNKIVIDSEYFENFIVILRDIYAERLKNQNLNQVSCEIIIFF